MLFQAGNVGARGVIKDQHPALLPSDAWTYADAMRFESDAAVLAGETVNLFERPRPGVSDLRHVLPVGQGADLRYVVVGDQGVMALDAAGGREPLMAGQALPAVAFNGCTSLVFGGLPLLNIAGHVPLMWPKAPQGRLKPLSKWPPNQYCESLRCYHNYLIALNLSKKGEQGERVASPYKVMWSNLARPGKPPDWAISDPQSDAGAMSLLEGRDAVVDGLTLGEQFFVYKTHSTWQMDWVGGEWIFQFRRSFSNLGALARNCVVAVERHHFVLSENDVVLHDGTNLVSVLTHKVRRWLFRHLNEAYRERSFVYHNPLRYEVFVFFPMDDSPVPNMAVVYNYRTETAAIRSFEGGGVSRGGGTVVVWGVTAKRAGGGCGFSAVCAAVGAGAGESAGTRGLDVGDGAAPKTGEADHSPGGWGAGRADSGERGGAGGSLVGADVSQ